MFIRRLATLVATMLVVGALVTLVGCDNSTTVETTGAAQNNSTKETVAESNNDSSADTNSAQGAFTPGSKIFVNAAGTDIYLNMFYIRVFIQ